VGAHLELADIVAARERIAPYVRRTPLLSGPGLDAKLRCAAYLKAEMLQVTGSFKVRGAFSRALLLSDEEKARGVIASSSGNHAQALAYAGKLLGVRSVFVVPHDASRNKLARAEAYGAEVIRLQVERSDVWACIDEHVDNLVERYRYVLIHACEDPLVMAGQGTIGMELLEDLPDVDTVVVPLGGGGLLSGIAVALKSSRPGVRVIGVEPALAPKYFVSRQNGRSTKVPAGASVADGVTEDNPGRNALAILDRYVDELALVEEQDIQAGMRLLAEEAKVIPEGAAAVGIGAVLSGAIQVKAEEKVCFVLSGGNLSLDQFLAQAGRIGGEIRMPSRA
jgi:threonine dehydratase